MKRTKFPILIFVLSLALLIGAIFVFTASAEEPGDGVLYEVTLADNTVVKVTKSSKFDDLLTDYPDLKSIKLYSDLVIGSVGSSKSNYIRKDLDINLNNFTITADGGYLRPADGAKVAVHDGNIDHKSSYFVFIGSDNSITVDNCNISATSNCFHVRNGTVNLTNSRITTPTSTKYGIFQISYDSQETYVNVDGCSFNDVLMNIFSISRQNDSVEKLVTVSDTVISTSKSIVSFGDQDDATGIVDVSFSGATKLSFSSFVAADPILSETTFSFAPGVKVSSIPTVSVGKICFINDATGFVDNTDADADVYTKIAIKTNVYYKLFTTGAEVINVSEKKTFAALTTEYSDIAKIVLYSDLEMNAEVNKKNYVKADLEIDLNGYAIIANGGYLYPQDATVTVSGGTISHLASNFAFVSQNSELIVEDCEINAISNCFHVRNGDVTLRNSTISSASNTSNAFFQLSYEGQTSEILVEGCTLTNLKMGIFGLGRNSETVKKTITVKDTVIGTSRYIISFSDQEGAIGEATFSFIGATKLGFGNFIATEPSAADTEIIFDEGVLATSIPVINNATETYLGNADGFVNSNDESYPYISADTDPKYTITHADGNVTTIYAEATFEELMKLCDNESILTAYRDLILTAEIDKEYATDKTVSVDLNGFTFMNKGARLIFYGSTVFKMYDGKIYDGIDYMFIYTGSNNADKNLDITFENCEITVNDSFIHHRNGSILFKDCVITTVAGVSSLASVSSSGKETELVFDGCTVNCGSAEIAVIDWGKNTVSHKITIKDTDIFGDDALVRFGTGTPNEGTVTKIDVIGASTLACASLDNQTNTYDGVVFEFGSGILMKRVPKLKVGKVTFSEGVEGVMKNDDTDYDYVTAANIPNILNPRFSLTLYVDFSLNLCFSADALEDIIAVKYGDKELSYEISNGYLFYAIDGISPISVAEKHKIEVEYYNYGFPIKKTIEYSVTDYFEALLKSDYSRDSKELIARAIDYSAEACEYAGVEIPESLSNIIESDKYSSVGNSGWVNTVPNGNANIGDLHTVIDSARLAIDTGVSFRFYLEDGIGTGELKVTSPTADKIYNVVDSKIGGKNYFDVEIRAFELFNGKLTITFGDVCGSYDFRAYANSDAVSSGGEQLSDLIVSMFNYFREANEYVITSDKDFKSTAIVVVKDGRSGTVTYILDDGDAGTGRYTQTLLREYEDIKLTYGLIGHKYATLQTVFNEETGKYEYVRDENGNYVYTVNESTAALWKDIANEFGDRVEYSSHTFSHGFAGYNDEGGEITYVDSDGNLKTVTLPEGSASAELYATIQIFNEIFGKDALTVVEPGVPASETDKVIDGVLYPGYYAYYQELLYKLYEEGLLVSARGAGFGDTMINEDKVITADMLDDISIRLNLRAYSLKHVQDPTTWTNYIDDAAECGGWALMMMHRIFADDTTWDTSTIHLKEAQMRYIFDHTIESDVWVATFTEASKYYSEWSTAKVSTEYSNGVITVNLTDNENNEIYDEALTVKVSVPNSWDGCTVNGEALELITSDSGERYVYVNIVPDSGAVEIVGVR